MFFVLLKLFKGFTKNTHKRMIFPGWGDWAAHKSFKKQFGIVFFMVGVVYFFEELGEKFMEFLFFLQANYSSLFGCFLVMDVEWVKDYSDGMWYI